MRLLYAVSDHGFGHATRTVALLREALRLEPSLSVLLQTGPGAAPLLRRSFLVEGRVAILEGGSDPGLLIAPGSLRVDAEATAAAWLRWATAWPLWIGMVTDAVTAWGGCDAVIADVTPPALLVARRLGVPGVLLGNFTWTDLLPAELPAAVRETVRSAQSEAAAAFAYPFATGFDGAPRPRPLPLVARRPLRPRGAIRAALGAAASEPLIYLSSGQSSSPRQLWDMARELRARLLVPWNAPPVPAASGADEPLRIPSDDPEGQDYLAACDLVVGKVGYGTLSEALSCGVPVVMMLVDGTPETGPLQAGMKEAGAGIALPAGTSPREAIADWLGRGGGAERPWRPERTREAAGELLGGLREILRAGAP